MDAIRSAAHALRARLVDRLKAKRNGGGSASAAVTASLYREDNEVVSTRGGIDDWGIYEEIHDGEAVLPCTYEDFANCNLRSPPGYRDRIDEADVYGLCGGDGGSCDVLATETHSSPSVAGPDSGLGSGDSGSESTLETLVALHAFAGLESGLLSFERGDLLDVLVDRSLASGGWWLASNSRGQVGLVPSNYLASTSIAPVATTVSVVGAAELASTASSTPVSSIESAATAASITSAAPVSSIASAAPVASAVSAVTAPPTPAGGRPRPVPRRFARSPQSSAEHDRQWQRAEIEKEQKEDGQNECKRAERKELERLEPSAPVQPERAPVPAPRRPSCRPVSEQQQQQRRSAPPASNPQSLPPSPPRPRPRASTANDGSPLDDARSIGTSAGVGDKNFGSDSEYATVDAGALPYFHPGVERDECNRLLVHDGDYLLRDSRNGNLTLSVKGCDRIHHFLVSSTAGGRVAIGRLAFPHIAALTDHYQVHAIYKSAVERLVLGRAVVCAPALASSTISTS